eukprot:gene31158-41511_t
MEAKLQELESILIHTYHPDAHLRHQAESALHAYLRQAGGFVFCLHFLAAGSHVHRDLRQATAIVIKNNTRPYWDSSSKPQGTSTESVPIVEWSSSPEEREAVKALTIEVLLKEVDNSIRDLLAETLKIISEFEFPLRWPTLVPQLVENISSPDVLKIYNSLLALRKLVKRYEYKKSEHLMSNLLPHHSLEAAAVMRMGLKILWSCTMYTLPKAAG